MAYLKLWEAFKQAFLICGHLMAGFECSNINTLSMFHCLTLPNSPPLPDARNYDDVLAAVVFGALAWPRRLTPLLSPPPS